MSDVSTAPEPVATPAPEAPASEPAPAAPETAPEGTETKPAEQPSIDDDLKAVWKKLDRERDESGRFKAEEPTIETPDQAPKVEAVPVPNSWSAEVREKWAQLPPDLQGYISKRESDAHSTISRQGQQIKALEPVQQILERGREVFQRYGIDEVTGVTQLIEANNYLERDPVNAIHALAQAYGVDLRRFASQSGQAGDVASQLQARIDQLEAAIRQTQGHVEHQHYQESERQVKTIEAQVMDFAKDKPDFNELESDVYRQIVAIKADQPDLSPKEILAQAYDAARWANPQHRARVQKEQRDAEEKQRLEEAKKRAADAKKSQPLQVRSSTANSAAPKTMDDTLAAIARKAYRS